MTVDERVDPAAAVADYLADTSSSTDPFPAYRALREVEPVHWSERLGYWVVTSWAEANACLRDPRLSRHEAGLRQFGWIAGPDDPPQVAVAVDAWLSSILNLDPPDHTRLRRLIAHAFTPRAVAGWQARTEEIVAGILAATTTGDEVDILADVGYPVPEAVICELLSVPLADHDRWKSWTGGLSRGAVFAGKNRAGDELPREVRARAQDDVVRWFEYFGELVEQRRSGGDDLVSVLVRAEEEGDRLSGPELIGTLMLLIGAGHETTANLIANGMLALLRHPHQYAHLREQPALAASMVEEVLRYDGPARGQPRVALADIELGGTTIRRGDMVMVIVNAANRDPAHVADPDRFDIARRDTTHLAFASGIHFCIGAPLARLEAEVTFRRIAELDVVFELATDQLAYKPSHGRNLIALPVHVRSDGALRATAP